MPNPTSQTPLTELRSIHTSLGGVIYLKEEQHNPSGSIKDRMVAYALDQMFRRGTLAPGSLVVEASSGNTGSALALAGKQRNLRIVVFVSDSVSPAKIATMETYGAVVVKVRTEQHPGEEIEAAKRYALREGGVYFNQFENPYHVEGYRNTIAIELVNQLRNRGILLDAFVAGIGSGATIIAIGEVLKEQINRNLKIFGVSPTGFPTDIEGLHPGHIVPSGHFSIWRQRRVGLEEACILVNDEDAYSMCRSLADHEGLNVGPATGACVWAANIHGMTGNVLVIGSDSGAKYAAKIEKWKRETK